MQKKHFFCLVDPTPILLPAQKGRAPVLLISFRLKMVCFALGAKTVNLKNKAKRKKLLCIFVLCIPTVLYKHQKKLF